MLFVFITDCIAPRKNPHIYFRLLYRLYYEEIYGIILLEIYMNSGELTSG